METHRGKIGSVVWDKAERQSVKGLHTRVNANGKRSWLVYYRTKDGKQCRPRIGDCDILTLGQARDAARAILAQVQLGLDPREAAQKKKAEAKLKAAAEHLRKKSEPTIAELFQATFDGHWNTARYRASGRSKAVEGYWESSLKEQFGNLPFSELTPTKVNAWMQSLSATPYQANRAKEILNFIFTRSERYLLIPRHSNPCPAVDNYKEKSRTRYATPEELKAVWAELEREEFFNPTRVAFLRLLLLTGSRPIALQKARRDQLQVVMKDGRRFGILTSAGKSTGKTGQDETIIFAPEAMAIVDQLPEDPNGLLIGCVYPVQLWNRIRQRLGCLDLRARDLRRTFATHGFSNGVNLNVIGELLNHSNTNTTKIYAKLMSGARLEAAGQIAGSFARLLDGPKPGSNDQSFGETGTAQ